jgi:hypothetical protein
MSKHPQTGLDTEAKPEDIVLAFYGAAVPMPPLEWS